MEEFKVPSYQDHLNENVSSMKEFDGADKSFFVVKLADIKNAGSILQSVIEEKAKIFFSKTSYNVIRKSKHGQISQWIKSSYSDDKPFVFYIIAQSDVNAFSNAINKMAPKKIEARIELYVDNAYDL